MTQIGQVEVEKNEFENVTFDNFPSSSSPSSSSSSHIDRATASTTGQILMNDGSFCSGCVRGVSFGHQNHKNLIYQ